MHGPKAGITATLLRDGKVLVMGALTIGTGTTSAELYDPATGTWTATGDFARPDAHYGSATLLSDGTVLVADDYGAELYDPGTGSWTTTGYLLRRARRLPSRCCSMAPSSWQVAPSAHLTVDGHPVECTETAQLSCTSLPACRRHPCWPSRARTPTTTPSPTPSPTPVPPRPSVPSRRAHGPGRSRSCNRSSEPATLFVAEEDEHGLLGRLVGSATPNVVPPGATVKVTFLVPAKGTGWAIFVNPRDRTEGRSSGRPRCPCRSRS